MKSLQQMVRDQRDLAAMLMEHAADMEELANFFGGGMVTALTRSTEIELAKAAAEPKKKGRPLGRKNSPKEIAAAPTFEGGTRVDLTAPAAAPPPPPPAPKVKLTDEIKAAVRSDWAAFPKHLQTTANLRALAAKHGISIPQIVGLTKDPAVLQRARALIQHNRNGSPRQPNLAQQTMGAGAS
jgi:hypothetical protein